MRRVGRLNGPGAFYHDCHRLRRKGDALKRRSFDVLVAGGGPAGVAAAVSAARLGARVVLVEREKGLGGNVRAAQVHSICGLYRMAAGPTAEPLQGGLAMEFARQLLSEGGARGPRRFGRLDVLLQEPEAFARLCEDWVGACAEIEVMRGAVVTGGEMNGKRVASIRVGTPEGAVSIEVGAVVEATGDGNLAEVLDLPSECAAAGDLQRPAYIFGLAPVSPQVLAPEARLALSAQIVAAVREGQLGREALGAAFRPTCRDDLVRVTLDLEAGGADYDPRDEVQVRRLTTEAAESACDLAGYLRRTAPGFERAEICHRPERVGIRESRRVTGRHVMTADEVLRGVVPSDTVCFSCWPLEWHESGAAMRLVYPEGGAPCGVPLRALQSREAENVFLAGRCLSATHEAQAALRVIGTSMATGQAAGHAAVCAARREPTDPAVIREACCQ